MPQEKIISETFRESQDKNARTYLTRVLQATGGERQRAAEIAGLNRTHLQSLIARFGIDIPFDPKARGRRRTKSERQHDEVAATEAARDTVRV